MSAPPDQTTLFIVDLVDEKVGFVHIDNAVMVTNMDGDLIFVDREGTPVDMIARGQWKRVKVRYQ